MPMTAYTVRLSQEAAFCPYRSLLATGAVLFKRGDFKAKAVQLDDKTRWLLGAVSDKAYPNIPANAVALPVRREFARVDITCWEASSRRHASCV